MPLNVITHPILKNDFFVKYEGLYVYPKSFGYLSKTHFTWRKWIFGHHKPMDIKKQVQCKGLKTGFSMGLCTVYCRFQVSGYKTIRVYSHCSDGAEGPDVANHGE